MTLPHSPYRTPESYHGIKRGKSKLRKWYEKPKAGTRARVKRELHAAVSLRVRLRDRACVLCGETDWQKLTCGHFYKRDWIGTAFDLRNCNCLCKRCNYRDNINHLPYADWMAEHYGFEVVDELFRMRNSKRYIPTAELEELLEEMKYQTRRQLGRMG